jgi:hypothetical protein
MSKAQTPVMSNEEALVVCMKLRRDLLITSNAVIKDRMKELDREGQEWLKLADKLALDEQLLERVDCFMQAHGHDTTDTKTT